MLCWSGSDRGINLGCRVSLWRGLRFGNWSTLEEVITQGSFEIGYKLAHGRGLRDTKGRGSGVPDWLKLMVSFG